MAAVDTDVFAVNGDGAFGFDDETSFAEVAADNYSGGLWTDRIEVIGPIAKHAHDASR
jgi:hypothetical protein